MSVRRLTTPSRTTFRPTPGRAPPRRRALRRAAAFSIWYTGFRRSAHPSYVWAAAVRHEPLEQPDGVIGPWEGGDLGLQTTGGVPVAGLREHRRDRLAHVCGRGPYGV